MLPFLKPKQIASVIMMKHKPEGNSESMGHEDEKHPMLMQHVEALMRGMHEKDSNMVAEALEGVHNHFNPKESDASSEEQE